MNTNDTQAPGTKMGRFKVFEQTPDRLVLSGRAGRGIVFLLLAVLMIAWALTAWASVFSGKHQTLNAAMVLTVLGLIFLCIAGAALGSRLTFDGKTQSVERALFFGRSKRVLLKPRIAYVSLRVNPATPNSRETVFLHLMNERRLVELYVASSRTDQADALALIKLAEQARRLLALQPRCEGTPSAKPSPFAVAYAEWASNCPAGSEPLRAQIV